MSATDRTEQGDQYREGSDGCARIGQERHREVSARQLFGHDA